MSAGVERSAIGRLFEASWAGRTPISWPNVRFDPPDSAYVKFSIVQGFKDQIEIGGINNTKRVTGRVFLQVFIPVGLGDQPARTLCDAVAAIFQGNKELTTTPPGRVLFREPVIRDIGSSGPHYQMNVAIPYLFDTL